MPLLYLEIDMAASSPFLSSSPYVIILSPIIQC
jgi:hypothetical protein